MTSPYEDLGGQREPDVPGPYVGCWHRPCSTCGAQPGNKCTFRTEQLVNGVRTLVTKFRHHPCVSRTKSTEGAR